MLLSAAAQANDSCKVDGRLGAPSTGASVVAHMLQPTAERRAQGLQQLAELSRTAVAESPENKAAEFERSATTAEVAQVVANRQPSLTMASELFGSKYRSAGNTFEAGAIGTTSFQWSGPIYDGGRLQALQEYRERLAGASSAALGGVRERVVAEAILATLERNRYRDELKVQALYLERLTCITTAIEQITQADPGRASEFVQARKSRLEAEVNVENVRLALRQAELRLERLVRSTQAAWGDIGVPLQQLPAVESVLARIENTPELRRLQEQALAQERLAQASAAEGKPQLRWELSVSAARRPELSNYSQIRGGFTLNYTLFDFGARNAAADAAMQRALAARQNYEQALRDRSNQAQVLITTAETAFRRAEQFEKILADSDRLRNSTYVQWATLASRSLFDLMSAENQHLSLQQAYVDAAYQGYVAALRTREIGADLVEWLTPEFIELKPNTAR